MLYIVFVFCHMSYIYYDIHSLNVILNIAPHTHTHARTRAHARTRTHAHTHTHTPARTHAHTNTDLIKYATTPPPPNQPQRCILTDYFNNYNFSKLK
jgi:hypothetical protein